MNFEQLLDAASKQGISPKLIEIWIPKEKFIDAVIQGNSLSITRIDDPFYGMAFGPEPYIDARWTHFSCTRSTPKSKTSQFKLDGQWDAYGIETKEFDVSYEILKDPEAIDTFIETHAPQSSIRARDKEVVAWVGISNIALGAICKWESGGYVLSAIVVAEEFRGEGFGKKITSALVDRAKQMGIDYVALGVWAKNGAAIATYKAVGFELLGQFNSFEV